MKPDGHSHSPRLARALVRRFVAEPACEFVLGDLEEEFHDHVLPSLGKGAARRWYWAAALASIRAVRRDRSRARASIPTPEQFMDHLLQNIRHTVRGWTNQPSVTLVALLALTLGSVVIA